MQKSGETHSLRFVIGHSRCPDQRNLLFRARNHYRRFTQFEHIHYQILD
jgi:hypothetical protein